MSKNSGSGEDLFVNIICYGIVASVFLAGLLLCWWNEDQTLRYYRLSGQASKVVVEMEDIDKLDPSLDGKLIHAIGQAKSPEELKDPLFDLSLKAFTFNRDVSYYQLVEHKNKEKNDEGRMETTYSYQERWVDHSVNHANFYDIYYRKKARYPLTTLKSLHLTAKDVTFGAYRVPEDFVKSARRSEKISPELTAERRQEIAKELGVRDELLHVIQNGIYIGKDPNSPHLGDVRVFLSYVPTSEVTILAKVKGDTFERFHNPDDPQSINISQIVTGAVSADDMFQELKSDVTWGSWLLRALSLIMVVAASFFLPWDEMIGDWELTDPARIGLAALLLTAGSTWLLNGFSTAGAILIVLSAISFPWTFILSRKKKNKKG
ncbi:TMEM43 family protein [bacterium]|nr:TMEM43 family protein [bacterium]